MVLECDQNRDKVSVERRGGGRSERGQRGEVRKMEVSEATRGALRSERARSGGASDGAIIECAGL